MQRNVLVEEWQAPANCFVDWEKIYLGLLMLPVEKAVASLLLEIVRLHLARRKFDFLIFLIPKSISTLFTKMHKNPASQNN